MENLQTQEALQATMRTVYENAMELANKDRLDAFMAELNTEEKNEYYVTLISHLSNRLKETEAKADFAALTITLAAVAAIAVIGIKNVKEDLDKKKAKRETLDDLIEAHLDNQITREELNKLAPSKKEQKYIDKMTNPANFK